MKYRSFTVEVVANGFIAKIGCQQLVFKTLEEVADAIRAYAKDPEGAAKKILENSLVYTEPGVATQSITGADAQTTLLGNIGNSALSVFNSAAGSILGGGR
jgi:hypothetical protein